MGFDKLAADLAGKPVLARTIQAFCECKCVDEIVIVCSAENESWVREIVSDMEQTDKVSSIVHGGSERHFSVSNGIDAVSSAAQLIGVHDGARPLITPDAITRCAEEAMTSGAATMGRPITDTVKRCDANQCVEDAVDRSGLWAMETPQIFSAQLLRNAYSEILNRGDLVTDEVSAVHSTGHPVKVVASDALNIKITYPTDLLLAARLLAST